jgi:drug/metabolite transporter (DMT)-like permease
MTPNSAAVPAQTTASPAAVLAAALFTMVVWGSTPMMTKIVVGAIPALDAAVWRTLLAGLCGAMFIAVLRVRPPQGRHNLALLLASAVFGFIGFTLLFSYGVQRTSASHAALIIAAAPIFTGLIAAAFERHLPGGRWWVGCGVALAGEAVLIGNRFDGAAGATVSGDLLVLAACLSAAITYVCGARLSRTYPAFHTILWSTAIGAVLITPLLVVRPDLLAFDRIPATAWAALVYLAVGASVVGYAVWAWALSRGDIARTGATQFVQPLIAVAFAIVFLNEPMTVAIGVSAIIIMAGVVLANTSQ